MPLRGRVGRHTLDNARECQNWSDDQRTVVNLLNHVRIADGGGRSLGEFVISGICSDELYRAISFFEDKYFPGQRRGYVGPGGATLRRMEGLAFAGGALKVLGRMVATPKRSSTSDNPTLISDLLT